MTENKEDIVRVNTFLSREQVEVLDAYARMMGITRSALLRGLLGEALPDLKKVLEKLEGFEDLSREERAVRLARFTLVSDRLSDGVSKGVDYL